MRLDRKKIPSSELSIGTERSQIVSSCRDSSTGRSQVRSVERVLNLCNEKCSDHGAVISLVNKALFREAVI